MVASKSHYEVHRAKLREITLSLERSKRGVADAEAKMTFITNELLRQKNALKEEKNALEGERARYSKYEDDLKECQKQAGNLRGGNPTTEPTKEANVSLELVNKLAKAQNMICPDIKDIDTSAICETYSKDSSQKEVVTALNGIHSAAINRVFAAAEIIQGMSRSGIADKDVRKKMISYGLLFRTKKDIVEKCSANPIANQEDFETCQEFVDGSLHDIAYTIEKLPDSYRDKLTGLLVNEEMMNLIENANYY